MYEKLLKYWQAGIATLEHFYANKFDAIEISVLEYETGNIALETVTKLFAMDSSIRGNGNEFLRNENEKQETIKVIIVPVWIQKDSAKHATVKLAEDQPKNSIFNILCLYAEVTKTGQILPCKTEPLPWVPRILTEPTAIASFSLGSTAQFDHYYHFSPPPWGIDGPVSWQEQLEYGHALLDNITKGAWKWHAHQLGYNLSSQVAVFSAVRIAKNKQVMSLLEVARKKKIWEKTFDTENAEAQQSISIEKIYRNSGVHFAHINNKHSLSMQHRSVLMQALALKQNEILYVKSSPGTGKTTIAQDLIATIWVQAIIDNKLPSSIAMFNKTGQVQKLTILDCLPEGSVWLTKYQRQLFYQQESMTDAPKSKIIGNFLEQCSKEFCKSVTNLEEVKKLLHERLMLLQTALNQGITVACSYYELIKKIDLSYRSYGGIEQRNKVIKETVEKQDSYFHYLEVLQSLWHRQVTPTSKWNKWLEFLPPFKKIKTQKLHAFFTKHLPDEDIKDFTISQMQEHLQNLLLKATKKKQVFSDILVQIEGDLKQLEFAKAAAKRWIPDQIEEEFELSRLMKFLDTHLRYRIFLTAMHYWEAELLQNAGWNHNDIFNEYYAINPLEISDLIQHPVDWLIVENGEHLSPIDGFYGIEGSKHLIVMGDSDAITPSRIPVEIDIALLRHYGLIDTPEDIEDLQFKGVLISSGQFSTFIEQIADYKGDAYSLNKQWDTSAKIIECQNQLSYSNKLQPCKKNKPNFIEDFSYMPLTGCRESFMGSFRNSAEVMGILNWIKQHEASILARYPEYSFADAILICTTFYGQCLAFRETFSQHNIDINNIELIQTLHNKRAPIVIFSPVYTKDDKGNLCFDQGEKILRNLLLCAKEHLLVFGDQAIFNPNLHSASGKFAKFLLGSSKNKLVDIINV